MGLFSFLKGAGAKIFDKKEEEAVKTATPVEVEKIKVDAMLRAVNALNLPVSNLSLDIHDDVVTAYGQAETQVAKELVVLTLGNNMGVSSVDDRMTVITPEPEATFYEVQSGDSLSKIAKEHYGDATKYNSIFEANKPMLKDPNLIYPGQMLRIPKL
ncbi:MAG: peptidoglycan-binding protein LysM [Bacteroidota bacterium]|nr:peptidoglycan-binding protein LysM [Bacteroidota bacterium]